MSGSSDGKANEQRSVDPGRSSGLRTEHSATRFITNLSTSDQSDEPADCPLARRQTGPSLLSPGGQLKHSARAAAVEANNKRYYTHG